MLDPSGPSSDPEDNLTLILSNHEPWAILLGIITFFLSTTLAVVMSMSAGSAGSGGGGSGARGIRGNKAMSLMEIFTRAPIKTPSSISIVMKRDSKMRIAAAKRKYKGPSRSVIFTWNFLVNSLTRPRQIWRKFKTFFFRKLPKRLRNLYVEAFLVPRYRWEWGKYMEWNFWSRVRKPEVPTVIEPGSTSPPPTRTVSPFLPPSELGEPPKQEPSITSEEPPEHDHSLCKIVRINVAGRKFETQLRTLSQLPQTLLGDPGRRERFWDPEENEYFLDRSPSCFESVMYYYQTEGKVLRKPFNVGHDMFIEELKFYDLDPPVIHKFKLDEGLILDDETVKVMPKNLLQRKLWLLFEYPESSKQARIVATISVVVIITSIMEFCMETLPPFNQNDVADLSDPFFFVETVCIFWFIFEFLMRIFTCPSKPKFVKRFANIIDFLAIVPYFIDIIYVSHVSGNEVLLVLKLIRLVRVFRILKLSRYNRGLQVLGKTLKASVGELVLLMFFLIIGLILFSSLIYYAESESTMKMDVDGQFDSIFESFWWAVITMTTVGLGDAIPTTTFGKLIGSMCAITGVLVLALPVPVIVSNFNTFYHGDDYLRRGAGDRMNEYVHVDQCPYLAGNYEGQEEGQGGPVPEDSIMLMMAKPRKSVLITGEKRRSSVKIPTVTTSYTKKVGFTD